MVKFSRWIEELGVQSNNIGSKTDHGSGDTTIVNQANVGAKTDQGNRDTTIVGNDTKEIGRSGDPVVAQNIKSLKDIHNQLRNVFSNIRGRTNAFRNSQMRSSFEKELMTGIDGVGRSHAILSPEQ